MNPEKTNGQVRSMIRKDSRLTTTQNRKLELGNTFDKLKDAERDSRCRSARDGHREVGTKEARGPSSRTRSVSPNYESPQVAAELPLKKFHSICSKIVFQLDLVKNLSENKSNEAENLLDLRRQLQRADEFSIRFSRNNLYETKRILNEIKKILTCSGGSGSGPPYSADHLSSAETKTLSKKIILGYQAASQSLQIYINYIKNSSNVEVPDKISELVLLIAELFLCCEHLSLPPDGVYVQNDAVKMCNELLSILRLKPPIGEYLGINQECLTKKKHKKSNEADDVSKTKNLSMYKAKCGAKPKPEANPKKKAGGNVNMLLGVKPKKMKKKDEKIAKITHNIYTQRMNPRQPKSLGTGKVYKLEGFCERETPEKGDVAGEKKHPKKARFFTPREVRSQDDDVETVVQTINDDEYPSLKVEEAPAESEVKSEGNNINKTTFRDLLLEAIEDLQNSDKKEQKETLKKILNSIQNCFKSEKNSPRAPAVKVFHIKHEENEQENDGENEKCSDSHSQNEVKERRLTIPFRAAHTVYPDGETALVQRKLQLRIEGEKAEAIGDYRKSFSQYAKSNVLYRRRNSAKPWTLIETVGDRIVDDVIREIAVDFENDDILKRLYLHELTEASIRL